MNRRALALALLVAGCAAPRPPAPLPAPPGAPPVEPGAAGLELLGSAALRSGTRFAGTVVGGLSGLAYDPAAGVYYAVSDDGGEHGPARVYTLSIDLGDGRLAPGGVQVTGVIALRRDGEPFPRGSIDAEGIALAPGGGLFIASEGNASRGAPPFVARFGLDGGRIADLPVPGHYLPEGAGGDPGTGVRPNLAFESLTATPDGELLIAATENALAQDGPKADLGVASPARLLVFDLGTGTVAGELVYRVEPLELPPRPADGFRVAGLAELLALDRHTLLALERGYSAGAGLTARLWLASLDGATDVARRPRLDGGGPGGAPPRPVTKTPLLDLGSDLGSHGVAIDNLEGMTFGPPLADGRRSLVIVADDNFSPIGQRTLFVAYALDPAAPAEPGATP